MSPRRAFPRRKLLSAGAAGSSAVVLGACGVQAPEQGDSLDAELLNRSLAAERALLSAYGGSTGAPARESEQISLFAGQVEEHIAALEELIAEAGGELSASETGGAGAGANLEAAAEALAGAIAAHREGSGELTGARRAPVLGVMANDAQQLAVLNGLLGREQVPFAFVTGGSEPPLGEPTEEEIEAATAEGAEPGGADGGGSGSGGSGSGGAEGSGG